MANMEQEEVPLEQALAMTWYFAWECDLCGCILDDTELVCECGRKYEDVPSG
jgi:hypothetical protein